MSEFVCYQVSLIGLFLGYGCTAIVHCKNNVLYLVDNLRPIVETVGHYFYECEISHWFNTLWQVNHWLGIYKDAPGVPF